MEILVDLTKCLGCKSCELSCAVARGSKAKTLTGALASGEKPQSRVRVVQVEGAALPIQCRHCLDAPCLDACPAGALRRDPETEMVLLNEDRCIGCYMCVMVCPFGVVVPTPGGAVTKCDRCWQWERLACVEACPTGALIYAEGWQGAEEIRVSRLEVLRKWLKRP